MSSGLTIDLLVSTLVIFIFALGVCSRIVPLPTAFIVTFAKVLLPFIYFAFFFDGSWTMLDDWVYLENGQTLISEGFNPFSSLMDEEFFLRLGDLAQGQHILYSWYNLFAEWIFGEHYYAPVLLNVGLTFGSAFFVYQIALLCKLPKQYSRGFFLFMLFHWELLAWSSFVNLKDTLVMFMTVATVYAGIRFVQTQRIIFILILLGLLFLFYWIRFYIPVLLLFSILGYTILISNRVSKIGLFIIITALATSYVYYVGLDRVSEGFGNLKIGFNTVIGGFKMTIIPQPWSLQPNYSFLLLPSIFHWVFFIPTLMGVSLLWRDVPLSRFLLVYLVIMLLFFGSYEELLGPRERVQLIFIYGWAQFHFAWYSLRKSKFNNSVLQNLR